MKKTFTIMLLAVLVMPFAVSGQATQIGAGGVSINAPKSDGIAARGDSLWKYGGVAGLTVSQTAVSNWSGGGDNALAFDAMFNYGVNYEQGKHLWQNRLELAYGMNITELAGAQKTNDKIYLSSLYGYNLGKNWYATALLNFQTQFANGFDYKTTPKTRMSQFMAPGYLSIGAGFTWKPKKWFTMTLSPATWRATWVCDGDLYFDAAGKPVNPFGVAHDQLFKSRMRNEFGANARFEINYDVWQNVNLYTRLDLYSNYLPDATGKAKPQNVDVRWDVIITAKINKWLSTNLTVNMLYDDDIHSVRADGTEGGPKFQVKEVLGIGLQAAF